MMGETFVHQMKRWPKGQAELCASLNKGDTVTVGELERVLGISWRHQREKFGKAIVALHGRIKRHFKNRDPSLRVTITYPQNGIHICTDEEAAVEAPGKFRRHYRAMVEAAKDTAGVNTYDLPLSVAQRHEMEMHAQCVALGAFRAALRPKLWIKAQRSDGPPQLPAPE